MHSHQSSEICVIDEKQNQDDCSDLPETDLGSNQVDYLETVCNLLDQVVALNDAQYEVDEAFLPASTKLSQAFQSYHAGFRPSYYLRRISRYTGASPCCFVVVLLYLDRLQARFPCMYLTSWTLQRLLLVVVMAATKYLEDICCRNRRWSPANPRPLQFFYCTFPCKIIATPLWHWVC